jgi:hypothetical protein
VLQPEQQRFSVYWHSRCSEAILEKPTLKRREYGGETYIIAIPVKLALERREHPSNWEM